MPKIDSTQVAIRIPNDLLALAPGGMSRTDLVIAALKSHLCPTSVAGDGDLVAALERAAIAERQIVEATARIDTLTREVAGWRAKAEAKPAVAQKPFKPEAKALQSPGDMRAAAVVTVPTDVGFRPFPVGSLAKGSKKKGAGNGQAHTSEGREAD